MTVSLPADLPRDVIDADMLAALLPHPRIKLVDATYGQPHPFTIVPKIAGAQAFDIDAIADPKNPLPHMLPDAESFAAAVAGLGISNDDYVIVYDRTGMAMAAARAWWMFRVFGHDAVAVLNGGLPAWHRHGLPMIHDVATPARASFSAAYRPSLVRNFDAMRANIDARTDSVIDARDPMRFAGAVPEPRPGMATGHIPQSENLFFASLLNPDGTLQNDDALRQKFSALDAATHNKPIVATCGSGVTACVVALALYRLGLTDAAVYDGSWSEWGQHSELAAR